MHYLVFDRDALFIAKDGQDRSLEISFRDYSVRLAYGVKTADNMRFGCLIGLKYVKEIPFLLLGLELVASATIDGARVNQIKKIGFVAVAPEKQQQEILKSVAVELQQLQMVFELGFHYFSEDYDLFMPFVFRKSVAADENERKYYLQFIWNYNLARMDGQKSEVETNLFWSWCSKIIQGYVAEFSCQLPGQRVGYVIISRRSFKKTGTRFYSRGIDDKGNVANFTESEQIVCLGDYIFSHLQIRGSVPAFFAQVGINGINQNSVVIDRSLQLTKNAFYRHFQTLRLIYGRILIVNLLTEKKLQEKTLSNFYQSLVSGEAEKMPYLRYQFYDFHQECKDNKFENSQKLIGDLGEVIEAMGYNCYQKTTSRLICKQKGVFRTNCLDCLDRTNYVQSRIALKILKIFVERLGKQQVSALSLEKKLLDMPVNEQYPLLRGFNELWADNGDAISVLYTGIGSTHTDITRTGERTLIGSFNHKFRSLMRFYIQFNDHVKHEAMNKLVAPSILRNSLSLQSDFHTTLLLSIDNEVPIEDALETLRSYILKVRPTIIVFFLFQKKEESFFEKLKCMATNKTTDFNVWEKSVSEGAESQGYLKVCGLMAERSWMGVFCLNGVVNQVTDIRQQNLSKEVSAGQALLMKMKLQNSSFIFAGVNFKTFEQYLTVFDQLHEKGFQISKLGRFRSSSFFDLDYKVVIGNTGCSIKMSEQQLQQLTKRFDQESHTGNQEQVGRILNKILNNDEFSSEEVRHRNKYLRQYNQGSVGFVPSSNRMVFWNKESVILKVREYQEAGQSSIVGVLDYEIVESMRSSLYLH